MAKRKKVTDTVLPRNGKSNWVTTNNPKVGNDNYPILKKPKRKE